MGRGRARKRQVLTLELLVEARPWPFKCAQTMYLL
jgi:hypothetical protein